MPEVIWIQTFTGKKVDPLNINPEDIDIEDVAHGLSNLCRYNGQCKKFYSVAEHSVYVSRVIEDDAPQAYLYQLAGLLHDAPEAYMGDVTRPLKSVLPTYCQAEANALEAVADRFGIQRYIFAGMVRKVDHAVLELECNQIMHSPIGWHLPVKPWFHFEIECWTPEKAKSEFMSRFQRLYTRAHGWKQPLYSSGR